MWGIVAGLVSYPVFSWYSKRFLDDQGLESGFTRMLLVFLVATILSSALGYGVSWLTTPAHTQSTQAALEKKSTVILGKELHCLQNPSSPACQSAAQQGKALENQLLGSLGAGSGQQ